MLKTIIGKLKKKKKRQWHGRWCGLTGAYTTLQFLEIGLGLGLMHLVHWTRLDGDTCLKVNTHMSSFQ